MTPSSRFHFNGMQLHKTKWLWAQKVQERVFALFRKYIEHWAEVWAGEKLMTQMVEMKCWFKHWKNLKNDD